MLTHERQTLWKDGRFVCNETDMIRAYYNLALSGFTGDVLTTGLGLGVAASFLLSLPAVKSVCVIEQDPEIVGRFAPAGAQVILADAWEWKPDRSFDCAFHDIWSQSELGVAEAQRMEKMFAPFVGIQVSLPLTYGAFLKSNGTNLSS